MKNVKNLLKNSFRLAFFGGMFVVASVMLSACGESTSETTTTDTVTTEPAPVIDTTTPVVIDTAATDSGRAIMDPKKPE
jgi:hypothetical protein